MKKRKPRKPKLEGWYCHAGSIFWPGPGVIDKKSGRFCFGTKRLEQIGKFFLAAAKWAKAQEGKK